jgi:hypothetical protein
VLRQETLCSVGAYNILIASLCRREMMDLYVCTHIMGGDCYKWILSPLNGTLHTR